MCLNKYHYVLFAGIAMFVAGLLTSYSAIGIIGFVLIGVGLWKNPSRTCGL